MPTDITDKNGAPLHVGCILESEQAPRCQIRLVQIEGGRGLFEYISIDAKRFWILPKSMKGTCWVLSQAEAAKESDHA